MKKILITAFLLTSACCLSQKTTVAEIYLLSSTEVPLSIGTVQITDTLEGLLFEVDLENLPEGAHGFHIHENGNCMPSKDANGNIVLAGKAGAHYDPDETNQHLGPKGAGHKGDLPFLVADHKGQVKTKFYHNKLSFDEIKNRSLIIHQKGDNYKDAPKPLGGGEGRMACGVIY